MRKKPREVVTGKRPDHEDLTVREIDEPQHTVNHCVTQRDQRVNRSERNAVDELLAEFVDSL